MTKYYDAEEELIFDTKTGFFYQLNESKVVPTVDISHINMIGKGRLFQGDAAKNLWQALKDESEVV